MVSTARADPPAQDDTERRIEKQVVDIVARRRALSAPKGRAADHRDGVAPADHQPANIGQRIPADRETAEPGEAEVDLDQGRADFRKAERGGHQCVHAASFPCLPRVLSASYRLASDDPSGKE